MQIWALMTRSLCRVSDTQVTVKGVLFKTKFVFCLIECHCFLASNGCLVSWFEYVLHNLVDFNTSFHFRMQSKIFIVIGNGTTIPPEVNSTILPMDITTVDTTVWSNSAVIAGVSSGAFLVLFILVAVGILIRRKVCLYC